MRMTQNSAFRKVIPQAFDGQTELKSKSTFKQSSQYWQKLNLKSCELERSVKKFFEDPQLLRTIIIKPLPTFEVFYFFSNFIFYHFFWTFKSKIIHLLLIQLAFDEQIAQVVSDVPNTVDKRRIQKKCETYKMLRMVRISRADSQQVWNDNSDFTIKVVFRCTQEL